ncbi:homing endonuclease [Yersinia phage vB_YenP_Rambo]|uniref:Homing endonuclease n=1 Tax=Yersinia phage vB_YenP_Rambo TaxID=2880894 RepID=A0AC61TNU5_9CAUD|nr:homing endonuclease [Yersinia phage vB_YenP_Rambo]
MKYKVNKTTGCWEFTGCKTKSGYGRIRVKGVHWMAHRYALSEHLGRPIAEGMVVMHLCDNPSCVNPEHLKEGTQKDNMEDCISKGRATKHRGPRVNTKRDPSEERKDMVIRRHLNGWTPTSIAKYHKLSVAWVKRVIEDYVSA